MRFGRRIERECSIISAIAATESRISSTMMAMPTGPPEKMIRITECSAPTGAAGSPWA
jgi:hypothetical protein